MLKFNDKLLKRLTKESSKKNITKLLDILSEHGYVVTPPIKEFLEIFDGYTIKFKDEIITFDCLDNLCEKEVADRYSETIEEQLLPLGFNNNSFCLLFMISSSGKIYAGFDGLFYLVGNDYLEAFFNLVNKAKFQKIELKVKKCSFTNNVYKINANELDICISKFSNAYIFKFDGEKCKTWPEYNEAIKKQLPLKKGHIDTLADYEKLDYTIEEHVIYMRQIDPTYLNQEAYLFIINNYQDFLSKDLKYKEIFEKTYKKEILSWYDDLVEKETWSGSYKQFNLILVNND